MRKNISINKETLKMLEELKIKTGLNHSDLIRRAVESLWEKEGLK